MKYKNRERRNVRESYHLSDQKHISKVNTFLKNPIQQDDTSLQTSESDTGMESLITLPPDLTEARILSLHFSWCPQFSGKLSYLQYIFSLYSLHLQLSCTQHLAFKSIKPPTKHLSTVKLNWINGIHFLTVCLYVSKF